jgi:hypothetical protein
MVITKDWNPGILRFIKFGTLVYGLDLVRVVEVRWDKAGTEPAEAYTVVCTNMNINTGLQGYGKHTRNISLWLHFGMLLLYYDTKICITSHYWTIVHVHLENKYC